MKTDINNFTAAALLARLAVLAPSIAIETIWKPDPLTDDSILLENGQDPDDFNAWQSEVRASCIVGGKSLSGSSYLSGTWEKYGDMPAQSNPEISGYLPQMIIEAFEGLRDVLPSDHPAQAEIASALAEI